MIHGTPKLPDLTGQSLSDLSAQIRAGALSPVTLTRAYLDRIAALNPMLHAYVAVFAKTALTDAQTAEDEIRAGRWRGPLHGIGIALKDNIYSREGPTTCHSRVLSDHAVGRDAAITRQLREAGAIILGKLAMWEFATGGANELDSMPAALNPWDITRSANGSSSGSAVAVAAGMCAASFGTDTGGSIRNPAAWCGVVGLKPTYDAISREGVFPVSWSLDHVGPLAWSCADAALVMGALCGTALTPARQGPLRIGVVRHYFTDGAGVAPEMTAALRRAEVALTAAGHTLADVHLPPMRLYQDVGLQLARSEAFAVHEATLRDTPELYGPAARRRLMMGAFVRASDYVNAQRERRRLVDQTLEAMAGADILLLPAARHTACRHGDDVLGAKGAFFGRPFNVTGAPAVAVPAGQGDDGMPLSLQLAARPFEDLTLLAVAGQIEDAMGSRARPVLRLEVTA